MGAVRFIVVWVQEAQMVVILDKELREQIEAGDTIKVEAQSVAYIKLMKNTKGYNWEIKQLSLNLEELEQLNNQMINKFGAIE